MRLHTKVVQNQFDCPIKRLAPGIKVIQLQGNPKISLYRLDFYPQHIGLEKKMASSQLANQLKMGEKIPISEGWNEYYVPLNHLPSIYWKQKNGSDYEVISLYTEDNSISKKSELVEMMKTMFNE
ncbi:hypothetical protein ELQ35_14735 [Peribacillus cavernae]|uniref:Uncharacterized protein n=1 Tax=Peribacillus cavernae TaxID=1674310 RepID=A0A433HHH6_9BACI|nr:hypothetical protein [Peribacillus cavernae]MDQ0219331.1 hypothetical protein [Peribacillus cavernae]RUQ27788.1 hypothetical protein ELQ35_14735 [Peribacillus cavernae]